MTDCACYINVYLGKDRQNVTQTMTATHVAVRSLTRRVEGVGHKGQFLLLYRLNFMTRTQEASIVDGTVR
jgi:hypothetical protein